MGNFFFKPRPPVVIEEAVEVFETNPSAEVIQLEIVDDPVQYELN